MQAPSIKWVYLLSKMIDDNQDCSNKPKNVKLI